MAASIFVTPFAELDYYHEAPLKGQAPKTARDAGITLEKGEHSTFDIDKAWRDFCEMRWDSR